MFLVQMNLLGWGFGTQGLKLLPGTSIVALLEVGTCQVYQEKAFWGEHTIIDLVEDESHGVCVNEGLTKINCIL